MTIECDRAGVDLMSIALGINLDRVADFAQRLEARLREDDAQAFMRALVVLGEALAEHEKEWRRPTIYIP